MCGGDSSTYQTEGAIFSPQQVGQQTRQGGLIPPAPPRFVEVGGDGQVDVGQKADEEAHPQGQKATRRQLLLTRFGSSVSGKLEYRIQHCCLGFALKFPELTLWA